MFDWPLFVLLLIALIPPGTPVKVLDRTIRARWAVAIIAALLLSLLTWEAPPRIPVFAGLVLANVAAFLICVETLRATGPRRRSPWLAPAGIGLFSALQLFFVIGPNHFFESEGTVNFWFLDAFNKLCVAVLVPLFERLHLSSFTPAVLSSFGPMLVAASNHILAIHFLGTTAIAICLYETLRWRWPDLAPAPPLLGRSPSRWTVGITALAVATSHAVPTSKVAAFAAQITESVLIVRGAGLLLLLALPHPWMRLAYWSTSAVLVLHPAALDVVGALGALDGLMGLSRRVSSAMGGLRRWRSNFNRVLGVVRLTARPVPILATMAAINVLPASLGGQLGVGVANEPTGTAPCTPTVGDTNVVIVTDPGGSYGIDRYEFPDKDGVSPRTGVDALEADRLCAEAGKRLCTRDEWAWACSDEGRNDYLFGDRDGAIELAELLARCNLGTDSGLVPAGSRAECRNALGIHDLVGNAWEWVRIPARPGFFGLAGSFFRYSDDMTTSCGFAVLVHPAELAFLDLRSIGFRCCSESCPTTVRPG